MSLTSCVRPEGCAWRDTSGMCRNSCYSEYSRALSAKWDAEDAARTVRGVFLGCPVCKQRVRFSCYHDGDDVSSREIPLSEERVSVSTEEVVEKALRELEGSYDPFQPELSVTEVALHVAARVDEAIADNWVIPKP